MPAIIPRIFHRYAFSWLRSCSWWPWVSSWRPRISIKRKKWKRQKARTVRRESKTTQKHLCRGVTVDSWPWGAGGIRYLWYQVQESIPWERPHRQAYEQLQDECVGLLASVEEDEADAEHGAQRNEHDSGRAVAVFWQRRTDGINI